MKAIKLHKFPPQLKFLVQFISHARKTPSRLKYCPLFSLTYIFPHTFTYTPKAFLFFIILFFLSFARSAKKRVHAPINGKKFRFVICVERVRANYKGLLCENRPKKCSSGSMSSLLIPICC